MPFLAKYSIGSFILACALITPVGSAEQGDEVGVAYFENYIRPLLSQHCYQCHSKRAKEQQGKLLLDSREGWLMRGENGHFVVPGDVEASLVVQAIRYADPDLQMPPSRQLTAEDIARIEHWVRIGAPGPTGSEVVTTADPSDPIAGKSHWAYQPLAQPHPPVVEAVDWPRSAIDRFVLARLERDGLMPVPDAGPRDLVRRIYFQLTGLPPSPQQVEAFLADSQPIAYELLVDRLLASPRYGERWGRHWLDLARYADSNGLDENFLFREAWRFRNWVIDATNVDLPFDRFVLEQIAGDLLPFDSIPQRDRQRIAASFLVIGPKVLLGNNEKNQRMEVADEQIDTIGRAILGQTLGCARCHDHKFDPIPTADYYALAGIFASTSVMESRYMLGQQRVMERLVGLGPEGMDADEAYEKYWRKHPKLTEKKKLALSALAALKEKNDAALAALVEKNAEALASGASDDAQPLAERILAQEALIAELTAALANPPKIPPRAMIPADVDEPSDEHIRLAGQFDRLGEKVPRGFLSVLCDGERLEVPAKQSGRIDLGHWLTDEEGRAGQLVARVLANRIWHHLMGRGLVRTVDNFGRTGEAPSHPELLDYLASELIQSGWSIKNLVRQIVLSRSFALSSQYDTVNYDFDPENRLLWRAHRRRLDPESFRDALLASAGQLDLAPMDSTVSYLGDQATAVGANKVRRRTDFPCRSVYLPVIRNDLPELFNIFDFANPHATTGARPNTIVPTQGLFLLNDEMVMAASEAAARRILADTPADNPSLRIDRIFELILNAAATDEERQTMQSFLAQTEGRLTNDEVENVELRALTIACHAMFASSRFQFLE